MKPKSGTAGWKRRDLLSGLAAAAAARPAAGQQASETIYVPAAHRVEDLALLHQTMEEYPFVELVTAAPSLRITHLPVWLDRRAGPYGTLFGHIARNNPQSEAIQAGGAAVVVFRGPHAYISPSWYENPKSVPTWNFAAIHASGNLRAVTDEAALYDLLSELIKRFETKYAGSYDFSAIPRSFVTGMMKGISGFGLRIEKVEGKFKLGQERSQQDRDSIVRRLESARTERDIAGFTKSFYRTRQRP
jgi:transcriptional regulator